MISLFKYFSARSSLKGINGTIRAMGGEDNCNVTLLAQRDMTEAETTYYWYRFISEVIYSMIFVAVLIVVYGVYDAI